MLLFILPHYELCVLLSVSSEGQNIANVVKMHQVLLCLLDAQMSPRFVCRKRGDGRLLLLQQPDG